MWVKVQLVNCFIVCYEKIKNQILYQYLIQHTIVKEHLRKPVTGKGGVSTTHFGWGTGLEDVILNFKSIINY